MKNVWSKERKKLYKGQKRAITEGAEQRTKNIRIKMNQETQQ